MALGSGGLRPVGLHLDHQRRELAQHRVSIAVRDRGDNAPRLDQDVPADPVFKRLDGVGTLLVRLAQRVDDGRTGA